MAKHADVEGSTRTESGKSKIARPGEFSCNPRFSMVDPCPSIRPRRRRAGLVDDSRPRPKMGWQLFDRERLQHDQPRGQLQSLLGDRIGVDLFVKIRPREGQNNRPRRLSTAESVYGGKAAAGVQGNEQIRALSLVFLANENAVPQLP